MAKTQITNKGLFETEDFLRLLGRSKAAAGMRPAEYYVLFNLAFDTSSESVKEIYDSLVDEEKRLEHVETTFQKLVEKAISNFTTGKTEIKLQAKREQLKNQRKKMLEEDQSSADDLLKQIKKI